MALSLAAQKNITVEDIYQGVFHEKSVDEIRWMKDGSFYTALDGNRIVKYDVTNGAEVEVLINGDDTQPTLSVDDYGFSADERQILIMTDRESIYRRSFVANYFIFDIGTKQIQSLSSGEDQSYATFSPDGSKVAFTRKNNLYYVLLDENKEVAVTTNGKFNELIHGSTDWVYEEEFSITKAFSWSADSRRLAYISFDERAVKEYNLQLWPSGDIYPNDYRFKYPKAGEQNSTVSVTIHNLSNSQNTPVDIGQESDIYIPRMEWTKDSELLSVIRMNRLQNQLEILHVNATSGKSQVIFTDKSDTYINIATADDLTYLADNKHFVISSEKSGFKHLYLYTTAGMLVRQITSGNFPLTDFIGVKEDVRRIDRSKVFYVSADPSPLDKAVFQIDITGKNKVTLSPARGTSSVDMSNDFQYFVLNYDNSTTPLKVSLHQLNNSKPVRLKGLESNEKLVNTIKEYGVPTKEFYTYKSADGQDLNAFMLKPIDFDGNKKYPVLIFQYSGPGSQNVANTWGGGHNYHWHQMLTQLGYIVVVQDTRGTGYRGADFEKVTYKQLGKYETEDHIAGAKHLSTLSYVDAGRIGIWGWSYGGYISSLAMFKGADYFKMGIAVAPVSTWRFYDTIYTERYLQRPQDNASGYDDNSPLTHASKLNGKFLLVHGTGDDNVHFQNSIALQDELILHGKQFQSFYYPNRTHGIGDYNARVHLYTMMTEFVLNNL